MLKYTRKLQKQRRKGLNGDFLGRCYFLTPRYVNRAKFQ